MVKTEAVPPQLERALASEATMGLRERKKAMTRLALEDAALELFQAKGFDHTTVDEIAEACNVSRRTFFRYFATKEDIFSGDKAEHDTEMLELIAGRPADEPALESLRAAVLAMAAGLSTDRARVIAKVKIINETSSDLNEFYASNVGTSEWEEDILGDDLVPAGGSVTINMDDGSGYCKFDFKGVFVDDGEATLEGIDVCEVGVVRFTE